MSGMWATPVIRVNYSGISGEGQEKARNLPFLGVIWRTAMPHKHSFPMCRGTFLYGPRAVVHRIRLYVINRGLFLIVRIIIDGGVVSAYGRCSLLLSDGCCLQGFNQLGIPTTLFCVQWITELFEKPMYKLSAIKIKPANHTGSIHYDRYTF
jgi:hypothetical protein